MSSLAIDIDSVGSKRLSTTLSFMPSYNSGDVDFFCLIRN